MPDRHGETWTLHGRDRLLAELIITGSDFPWLYARLEPHDGWAEVQPLFAEELRLLDHIDDETASWEAAYDAVREAVVLRYPDGNEVPEFLLHVRRPRGMVAMERRTVRGLRKTDVVLVRGTEDLPGRSSANRGRHPMFFVVKWWGGDGPTRWFRRRWCRS
jgi:hypothetical protein